MQDPLSSRGQMQPALTRFSLMCLNLRFGLADDGDNGWQYRQKAYPSLIKSYPADFYLFQEANDFQIDYLKGLLSGHDTIGQREPAPAFWQSNVIFHHRRWRCSQMQHFYLSPTPDEPSKFTQSRWPRQCTMGTFQCGLQTVTVVNTHFDFENDVQCRSAELIRRRIDAFAGSWPVVLAGDFNADADSDCYAILTNQDNGLANAFGSTCPGTFHGFSGTARDGAIDWILYRGNVGVRSAQVVQRRFSGCYPSDHFPLVVQFEKVT